MVSTTLRSAILWVTVMCIGVNCQPTGCTDDTHCAADFFCEASFCRECLHCNTFFRQDPLVPTKCVQSVTECGDCLKGLTDDHTGDPSTSCQSREEGVPLYVWICLGIAVPLIPVAALIISTFATSKLTLFKISGFTSTHTFQGGTGGVGSPIGGGPAGEPHGSAPPMPPPPYNTHFTDTPLYVQEEESPLVKMNGNEGGGERGAREAERRQAARVYNNPAYVRGAPLPHSHSPSPTLEHEGSPEPAALHDENTMESVWTPIPPSQDPLTHDDRERGEGTSAVVAVVETGAGAVSGAGDGGRGSRRRSCCEPQPPAKHLCLTQGEGSRNSGGREESPAGPSVMLNFNLNVNANAVQQLNNVTLFE